MKSQNKAAIVSGFVSVEYAKAVFAALGVVGIRSPDYYTIEKLSLGLSALIRKRDGAGVMDGCCLINRYNEYDANIYPRFDARTDLVKLIEHFSDTPKVVMVGGYEVKFRPDGYDGIQVGCQSIPTDVVDAIHERLHEDKEVR